MTNSTMKATLILVVAFFFTGVKGYSQDFITKWNFTTAATQINFFAFTAGGPVNYTWTASPSGNSGAGSFTQTISPDPLVTLTGLTIAAGDVVTLSMQPANLRRFHNLSSAAINPDNDRLIDVQQWGAVPWSAMTDAFTYCHNLNITATDMPVLTGVTGYQNMFYQCHSLTGPVNINSWNLSNATNMTNMFAFTKVFNQPLNNWNVSNVTLMKAMFYAADGFNQPLNNWHVSSVTNMQTMFNDASVFNQSLGDWVLHPSVDMTNMLNKSGLDCSNYSSTLKGWYDNNPAVTGRTLGANQLKYTLTVAAAERNSLITSRTWTITGDGPVTATSPYVVPAAASITGVEMCDAPYVNPANKNQKILQIDANGNSFTHAAAVVTVNNQGNLTGGGGSFSNAGTGYYQSTDGVNTIRISKRLHSVIVPGSYTVNGGVIVRVYYDDADLANIAADAWPGGSAVNTQGWFKHSNNTASGVVNSMVPGYLPGGNDIAPIASGTEGMVKYAEFKVSSFSTFGYYAKTTPFLLPVTLISFNAASENCKVKLSWKTAEEINFSHFEIERSTDGINYATLGTVNASGNNSNYNYTDNTPANGKNIYRLKMVDTDGKYKYSSLKLVAFNCNGSKAIVVHPNPVSDNINISLTGYTGRVQGRLFNNIGQLVKATVLVNGTNSIPANGFANGVYNLVITDEGSNTNSYKLIVQH